MVETLLNKLKAVPAFAAVPEPQLKWLAEKGTERTYNDGDKVFAKNSFVDSMQVLFRGEIDLQLEQGGNLISMGTYVAGDLLGKMPYSRMQVSRVETTAHGAVEVYSLHQDYFPELITSCHEVTEVLVHNMTDRARRFVRSQQQVDKMTALGKLSAGLAHELNNPSAAVIRSAQALKKHLSVVPENFKRVIKIQATDEIVNKVNDLVFSKIAQSESPALSLKEKTVLEDEITEWLENHDIDDAYDWVETFADYQLNVSELEQVESWVQQKDLVPILGWINQVLTTEKLVNEIEEASRRINALVSSVKEYTHMDQAPEKQKTDIHIGIRNTLTMLNHKLKKNNVKVIENFQPDLPLANIFVSEMNQVWTNLIDNAIDAMEGRSENILTITTLTDRDFINVVIQDNGPGIPDEIKDNIFDPFFTTKSIGKGTGIGLEVVDRIVRNHHGKIELKSKPGKTEFKICLPG